MRFASRQIRQKMTKKGDSSLCEVKNTTKRRYQQVLNFMKEWSEDLMERENELHEQRENYSNTPLQQNNPNATNYSLNIEQLIKEEFYKKVQSLYMKQLVIADMSQNEISQNHSEQDSLNHSRQSNNTFGDEEYRTSREDRDGLISNMRICDA